MQITVTFRRTSRLSIRITKSGEVHVSAPIGCPKREVKTFVYENQEWIEKTWEKRVNEIHSRNAFYNQLPLETKEQCKEATIRLNAIIPPLVQKYSKLMGVVPAGISYRANTSRWGSCNVKTKRLIFSAYLLLLPDWCIEHVVVHELAHLLVPNHGPKFHAVMDQYFPRWKEARATTRQITRNASPAK